MIRIGHIDFINTIPFDLEGPDDQPYKKIKGPPTRINQMLLDGEVDVAMISVAFFLEHQDDLLRIGNFGIVSDGPVMSVVLFSNRDLSKCGANGGLKLYETTESATSVILNRLILRLAYGVDPVIIPTILEAEAVLLIGNTALLERQKGRWDHQYDLGEEWKNLTGLPMVFAVLATRKKVFENKGKELLDFLELVKSHYRKSMEDLDPIVAKAKEKVPIDNELLYSYYHGLKYVIEEKEEQSMALFEKLIPLYHQFIL